MPAVDTQVEKWIRKLNDALVMCTTTLPALVQELNDEYAVIGDGDITQARIDVTPWQGKTPGQLANALTQLRYFAIGDPGGSGDNFMDGDALGAAAGRKAVMMEVMIKDVT